MRLLQVTNASTKANEANQQARGLAQESIHKLDEVRQDASSKIKTNVDKMDRKVEEKAAEAKGSLSGWFGGGK